MSKRFFIAMAAASMALVAVPFSSASAGDDDAGYNTSDTDSVTIGSDPNTDLLLTQSRVQDTLSRLPQEVQLQGVQVKKTIQALLLGARPELGVVP